MKPLIEALPKTELHVHLEGTLEPEMSFALAQKNGIALPFRTPEELLKAYDFHDLPSFLAIYYPAMNVLQDESDFFALTWAYLQKAHSQNILYAEMFFDPQAHTSRGVTFDTVLTGYRRAIVQAERELGISASLILCFLRDMSAEYAMATLMESLPYKDWIIAVGLDSDERDNPPSKFAEVFARARAEGYLLTSHCDIDQPGSIEHIRQVIEEIGVDRIDHGTNIIEDPSLVAAVRERGIGFTCCPVSNDFVVDDMKAAEIVQLLHDGVRVTVNSDDPAYFGAYITDNYLALAQAAALGAADVVLLARNAFTIAWLSTTRRDQYLDQLDAYAAAHGVAG